MVTDLLERVKSKYHRDGLVSLFTLVGLTGAKEPIRRRLALHSDAEIFGAASAIVHIEDKTSTEIRYGGMNEPPHPPQITAVDGEAIATPRVVCAFRDATLVGSRPVVCVDRRYIDPSTVGTADSSKSNWKQRKTFHQNVSVAEMMTNALGRKRATRHLNSAFLLTGQFDVFGHWSFEILPKLRAYEEYVKQTGTEPTILTRRNLQSWQQESLSLLGYPPESLSELGSDPTHVRQLLVPSHRYLTWSHRPTYPSAEDLRWVAKRMKATLPLGDASFGDRIFISREEASRRQIHNREAVITVLDEYDFEVYEPGRLSMAEQVQLFRDTELIVGPYGAGVSNIIFADEADFIELVVDAKRNIHHYVLAQLLGINYEYVRCRPHDERGVKVRNSDIVVDTDRLRDVLDQFI